MREPVRTCDKDRVRGDTVSDQDLVADENTDVTDEVKVKLGVGMSVAESVMLSEFDRVELELCKSVTLLDALSDQLVETCCVLVLFDFVFVGEAL